MIFLKVIENIYIYHNLLIITRLIVYEILFYVKFILQAFRQISQHDVNATQ